MIWLNLTSRGNKCITVRLSKTILTGFTYVKSDLTFGERGEKMIGKGLTARSLQILRVLFERGNRETVYNTEKRQSEIAEQFKITRQALNVHLKKLRNMGYVKTGRGFISVTEEGLKALGIYRNPAIVTVRVSPQKRSEAYEKIKVLPAIQILRVTGDVDLVIMSDQGKIDETLKRISKIDGVEETRSYVCIEILK